jgi:RNA polymerase sigma-70 factor (ECF subfamily)
MIDEPTESPLQRAQNGDAEAFAELFEPLRRLAYSVSVRFVGASEAEDVVMDAYLKAWQALPGFRGRDLKSWLLRITRNTALDRIRRQARRPTVSLDAGRPSDSETNRSGAVTRDVEDENAITPDDRLARNEDIGGVKAALALLPELYRISLLLRYADGLSYSEIAVATDVAVGTVMSRLHNGKRRLKRLLNREDGRRR